MGRNGNFKAEPKSGTEWRSRDPRLTTDTHDDEHNVERSIAALVALLFGTDSVDDIAGIHVMVHLHRSGNLHSPLPRRFEKNFLPTDEMANSRKESSPSGRNQLIQEEIQRKMLIFIQVNHHPIG